MRQNFLDKELLVKNITKIKRKKDEVNGDIEYFKNEGIAYDKQLINYQLSGCDRIIAKCNYTLGLNNDKVIPYIESYIKTYMQSINIQNDYSDGGDIGYLEILDASSFSILVLKNHTILKITSLLNETNYQDYLISFLLKDYGAKQYSDLLFPKHKSLQILKQITQSNKIDAEILLKEYLEKHYYTKENLGGVYNSHKTEKGYIFSGYWSWEAAAIVKVMGLDDSSFKDNPYYPYDMAHWQDEI